VAKRKPAPTRDGPERPKLYDERNALGRTLCNELKSIMMSDIVTELRRAIGEQSVLDRAALGARARNHWDATPLEARALVRPRSTEEVSGIMRLCHSRGQSVVVQGGLTGLCDGDRAGSEDVVLSLERMAAIEDIDVVGRTATVQAGCRLQELQRAAEREGLYFPLDLGARGSCTVGGNAATNAGGTNVIRYGMMRAQILGLEAVMPDGTVISSMNRMLKNNSGYDLKHLFIGSEGTLGIVTRIVVALKEPCRSVNTALLTVDTGESLLRLLKEMDRRLGGTLSSFEGMWGDYYRAVTAPGWHSSPLERTHAFYVIVEAQGAEPEDDARRFVATIAAVLDAGCITDAVLPKSESERERIWAIRENFEAVLQHRPLFAYDVSLSLRDMLPYVEEVQARLRTQWPQSQLFAFGHIGDGNLHFFVTPGIDLADASGVHAQCDETVYHPLKRLGGAVSAEHGIGLEKKAWLSVSRSPAEIALMRTLKRALDPKHILNPGKVIDC
jgi:FAD/FMN-containing dehydrogenase